ncbi:Putative fluoride ion transporter CrcB [Aeoliella mucimassa]|uniref:Fluoride-specific ion channel FluC n=1 Tax=Aeoliella mucimassa TaxID=2527972 RepID=A0A518ATU3_9BACT|nr:Putative fluoride ion transporter CrcB [Aeoliella mucimassa]
MGAVCRYGVVMAAERLFGERFPIGVLLANIAGCFILGFLMHEAIISGRWLTDSGRAAITIGFLGALTTFSTFGFDTVKLYLAAKPMLAVMNVMLNCGLGFSACLLGKYAGDLFISQST